jgi:hypothetical protein
MDSTKPDNRRIGEETRQTNRQTYVYKIDRAVDRRKDKHGRSKIKFANNQ